MCFLQLAEMLTAWRRSEAQFAPTETRLFRRVSSAPAGRTGPSRRRADQRWQSPHHFCLYSLPRYASVATDRNLDCQHFSNIPIRTCPLSLSHFPSLSVSLSACPSVCPLEAALHLPLTGDSAPGVSAQHRPPPAPAPPPNRKNQMGKRGKENICLQGEGAGPYEPFARTEQRKERRPEWNTHR